MLKKLIFGMLLVASLLLPSPVLAASTDPAITEYVKNTLNIITVVSTAAAVFFLVKSGYLYITSSGKPQTLDRAKKTIRNTLVGLVLILSANVVISVFENALEPTTTQSDKAAIEVIPIETVEPSDGLTQVLIDAVSGFIQNIVESATEPIVNGVLGYLTNTPTLLNNEVIRKFWLVSLGIVDLLFVIVVALLGLQVMSATTFGFDEIDIAQLLPRIGLSFLGANTSLFLADYMIITSNTLVNSIITSTGGLNHALITNVINPTNLLTGSAPLITLIFLVIFLIVSIVLLFLYISRLIIISLGAVLSPFVMMLWTLPKFSDFALISVKTYTVNVFMVFIHVVMIQLSGSFLALPDHSENSLISVAVAIGLFFTLIKTPNLMMQLMYYTSNNEQIKKLGIQLTNVISSSESASETRNKTQWYALKRKPPKI